jgi:hypothetical protein
MRSAAAITIEMITGTRLRDQPAAIIAIVHAVRMMQIVSKTAP